MAPSYVGSTTVHYPMAYNMNHPLYGAPDTTRTDARFGMLPIGQQNFPRYVQLSGKLQF